MTPSLSGAKLLGELRREQAILNLDLELRDPAARQLLSGSSSTSRRTGFTSG